MKMTTKLLTRTPTSLFNTAVILPIGVVALTSLIGCKGPIQRQEPNAQLYRSLREYREMEMGGIHSQDVTLHDIPNDIESSFSENVQKELHDMAGPDSYQKIPITVEKNLLGEETQVVRVNLHDAIRSTVENNLQLQAASMNPAITEAGIIAAEARFDSVIVTNLGFDKTDESTVTPVIGGIPTGTGVSASETIRFRTGIRRSLISGGSVELATSLSRAKNKNSGLDTSPDPAIGSSIELGIQQPLLRGFGSEVNLAQIRVNENAHRTQIEGFRDSILTKVNEVELAYWQLWRERQTLRVALRLLERGEVTKAKLIERKDFDVTPSEISDAKARVQRRKVQVRRVKDSIVLASDGLKQIMSAPEIPVGSEIMVAPIDSPVRDAITFNYRDAILSALQNRPEVRQALLNIDDSSIRQMLADNLRLPRLDVEARAEWKGLDDGTSGAWSNMTDGETINYILNAVLEFPIGNREAQANYRAARLQRMQSIVEYEQVVQTIIRQVKDSLRAVRLNYELLEPTRATRIAEAENLRTIEVKGELQEAMTPEFLNLKLQRQESLANAEFDELSTIAIYQISLAQLYTAMGVSLERNNIEFVVPESASFELD